eukprot:2452422-Amphidinium_carterae.2
MLVYDVEAAHRQILIRRQSWRYLAFRLQDHPDIVTRSMSMCVWGGNAAYWWGRVLAAFGLAAILRLTHYFAPSAWQLYHLLFVDDGLLV